VEERRKQNSGKLRGRNNKRRGKVMTVKEMEPNLKRENGEKQ